MYFKHNGMSSKKNLNEGSEKKRRKVVRQKGKHLAEFPEGVRNDCKCLKRSSGFP